MKLKRMLSVAVCLALLLCLAPAALASSPEGGDKPISLGYTLYESADLSLTLDELSFSAASGLTLACTAVNRSEEKAVGVLLSQCVIDGLCLPLDMDAPVAVTPGESVSIAVSAVGGTAAFALLGVESIGEIAVRYRVLDGVNRTVAAALSGKAAIPGGEAAAAYVPEGEPLCDADGLRVYSLSFDGDSGTAVLLLENTGGSWSRLSVDPVFDGVKAHSLELPLESGQRRVCSLVSSGPAKGVDVYCTPNSPRKLGAPVHLTLGSPAAPEESGDNAPLWSALNCDVRLAGVSRDYFSDSDVLLFECVNRNEDLAYWLYPSHGCIYLDGERMQVNTTGAVCYPGARCIVAVAVSDLGAPDLSEYMTLELILGLYAQNGPFLSQCAQSGDLKTELK